MKEKVLELFICIIIFKKICKYNVNSNLDFRVKEKCRRNSYLFYMYIINFSCNNVVFVIFFGEVLVIRKS